MSRYVKFFSRSNDAVIRVYDEAGIGPLFGKPEARAAALDWSNSLLFGAWTRLVFAAAALDGSFFVRNVLAEK